MPDTQLTRINAAGSALSVEDIRSCLLDGEAAHRELRPGLGADYLAEMSAVFADGARLTQLVDGGVVRAIAVWRVFHTTYGGRRLEVDDLMTREEDRSGGYGWVLLASLEAEGRQMGCTAVMLNSACARTRAHQFYFREGYKILAFHFEKTL